MKKKIILGLIATATMGTLISAPSLISTQNRTPSTYKVLLTQANSGIKTNEAVVINGNNKLNLYKFSNGKGVSSYISTGEMLTILGNKNGYYKVKVHETGAVGYIDSANMKIISNCENCNLTSLSGQASIINVSSVVNLRKAAGINSSIIAQLRNGQSVKLLGKQGDWYKVSVNNKIGFIYGEYIGKTNIEASVDSNSNTKAQASSSKISNTKPSSHTSSNEKNNINIKTTNSNIKQNSSNSIINKIAYVTNIKPNGEPAFITPIAKNFNIRWQINNGQPVKILGEKGDLYKISWEDGNVGYINKKYITFKNNENEIHPNDNALLSKYFGTWTVGKQVGSTIGEGGYFKSFEGDKIIMTKDLYSFNGRTVKNPNYYIVTTDMGGFFGNSKYDNFGDLQCNKYGQLELIVALPSSEKLTNKDFINGAELYFYQEQPIIASGNSLMTYGGGYGNTSINQCIRGDINISTKTPNLNQYIGKVSNTLRAGYIYSEPNTNSTKVNIPQFFTGVTKKIKGNWVYIEQNKKGKITEGWVPLNNVRLSSESPQDL